MKASKAVNQDTKWIFAKKGTCSRTLFYILDREYNNPLEDEEKASDTLAGGILQHGYQCGLLLGSVMGAGAEAYNRTGNLQDAIPLAINAAKRIEEDFVSCAGSSDCNDITEINFSSKNQMAKFMFSGKFYSCFKLADRWAVQAIPSVEKGLKQKETKRYGKYTSCASVVVEKMGGNEREQAIVSGLAGGVGLSGKACGALSAAIWYKTLLKLKKGAKGDIQNPEGQKILEAFLQETDYEFICEKIIGKKLTNVEKHASYINEGACKNLINVLSKS